MIGLNKQQNPSIWFLFVSFLRFYKVSRDAIELALVQFSVFAKIL